MAAEESGRGSDRPDVTSEESPSTDAPVVGTDEDRESADGASTAGESESTDDDASSADDGETGGHLKKIDDGCGCVEVWEALSDERE